MHAMCEEFAGKAGNVARIAKVSIVFRNPGINTSLRMKIFAHSVGRLSHRFHSIFQAHTVAIQLAAPPPHLVLLIHIDLTRILRTPCSNIDRHIKHPLPRSPL